MNEQTRRIALQTSKISSKEGNPKPLADSLFKFYDYQLNDLITYRSYSEYITAYYYGRGSAYDIIILSPKPKESNEILQPLFARVSSIIDIKRYKN